MKLRFRSHFCAFAFLLSLLLLLTACGASEAGQAESAESGEKQTVYFASTRYVGFDGPEDVDNMSGAFYDAFTSFNEENETYQLEAVLYKDETDIQLSMASGEQMDILNLYDLSTDVYLAKNLLLDLYPYIDNDADLSREDFVPAFLDFAERDGELNFLSTGFSFRTYRAPAELVGSEMGWTVAEFAQVVKSLPDGWAISYGSAEGLLSDYLSYTLDQYVDWEAGTINLHQDDFYTMLELCKDYCSDVHTENRLLNSVNTLDGVETYLNYCRKFADTETLIGYPGAAGNGVVRYFMAEQLAISAQSKCPEGAWEFLKYLAMNYKSNNYGGANSLGLPVLQSQLDALLDEAQQDELDEDGTVITEGMTDEERAGFVALLEGSENSSTGSSVSTAVTMILEEAASYFSGDKTAEEVINIMENRVGIYLSELT